MIKSKRRKAFAYAFIALAAMFFCGCATPKLISGNPIRQERVDAIQRGNTTKEDIIQWFGAPNGIVRKGEKMNLPKGKLSSDPFFDLFSSRGDVTKNCRIYYYAFGRRKVAGGSFVIPLDDLISKWDINMLLILINEETSIVEDYTQHLVRK